MEKISAMTDMRRSPKEKEEAATNMAAPPDYPWGLSISLSHEELDKLNLGTEDLEVGDILHMHVLAKVTSVSSSEHESSGKTCRVELQITHMTGESEDKENEEEDDEERRTKRTPTEKRRSRLYHGG